MWINFTSEFYFKGFSADAESERACWATLELLFYVRAVRRSGFSVWILEEKTNRSEFGFKTVLLMYLWTRKQSLEAIYLVSVLDPLTIQSAKPDPLGVSIIQTSHSQVLPRHCHRLKINVHGPEQRQRDKSSTGTAPKYSEDEVSVIQILFSAKSGKYIYQYFLVFLPSAPTFSTLRNKIPPAVKFWVIEAIKKLLPILCVVEFNTFVVGQAILGLDYVIITKIHPAGSFIHLPLVESAIRNLWIWWKYNKCKHN